MYFRKVFLVAGLGILFLIFSSFTTVNFLFCKKQGIEGKVSLIKGNQMPSPDRPKSSPPGLKTKVYIYELTHSSQAIAASSPVFFSIIKTKLIAEVESDSTGHFKVKLKPGEYSMFIKKDNLFYANITDDKNNLAPVKVEKGKFTQANIRADYDAVY